MTKREFFKNIINKRVQHIHSKYGKVSVNFSSDGRFAEVETYFNTTHYTMNFNGIITERHKGHDPACFWTNDQHVDCYLEV